MALDTTGYVLEEMRTATGNNPYCFPPNNYYISNLDAYSVRTQYLIWVSGQVGNFGLDISDPALVFFWSKNEDSLSRFDWDSFNKKWSPKPGNSPRLIGKPTNSPRLIVPVPNEILLSENPYILFLGNPEKEYEVPYSLVDNSSQFTNPLSGEVQISRDKGEVNFRSSDLINDQLFINNNLFVQEQSFSDRTKITGTVGSIVPGYGSYQTFLLNPIPGTNQTPLLRIGFRSYLNVSFVITESMLQDPGSGNTLVALDTGRIAVSKDDCDSYPNEKIYYDGVSNGSFSLETLSRGNSSIHYPSSFVTSVDFLNLKESDKYIFHALKSGNRYHFQVILNQGIPSKSPNKGTVILDTTTGSAYISESDSTYLSGSTIKTTNTQHLIEKSVYVSFKRSAVNVSGFSSVPDFKENYFVEDQVINGNLISSPFILLPTVPIDDDNLSYSIDMNNGTFFGDLVRADDTTKFGIGYALDLEKKQLQFTERKVKTQIINRDGISSIKLPDAAIYGKGIEVKKNDVVINEGVDFDFDSTTGMLNFIDSIGKNQKESILNLQGFISTPNTFISGVGSIPITSIIGYKVIIESGANAGIYTVTNNIGSNIIIVEPNFKLSGQSTVNITPDLEILSRYYWNSLNPEKENVSISIKGPNDLSYSILSQDSYSILPQSGQINLLNPLNPDTEILVTYRYFSIDSNTGISESTNITENATFKVRRELASYVPNTTIIEFNSLNKTIDKTQNTIVYVNGIRIESDKLSYVDNQHVSIGQILTDQIVYIDYYKLSSNGGETSFNLKNSPLDIDFIKIEEGSNSFILNGDYSFLMDGSLISIDNKTVFSVLNSSYDLLSNKTTVFLKSNSTITTDINSVLSYSSVVDQSDIINETNNIDIIPNQTNSVKIAGNVLNKYKSNVVLYVDSDVYIVVSSSYDISTNKTNVMIGGKAARNYISPSLKYTKYPINVFVSSLNSNNSLDSSHDSILYLQNQTSFSILVKDVDFSISDGGLIKLKNDISDGVLYLSYTFRVFHDVGDEFEINYANFISPNQQNGLLGQKLKTSYKLRSPDSYFFRVESIKNMISEVNDEIKKGNSGSSGPNISSSSSLQIWDYGNPSLDFDERHYSNLDITTVRLLKYFNDVVNNYEDMLSDIDGRVVGGDDGKFRFDGLNGSERDDYYEITNDLDDLIVVKTVWGMTNIDPVQFSQVKVYDKIWVKNKFSRFYPTFTKKTVAFNNNKDIIDYGKVLGSININNLTSVSSFRTTPSRLPFKWVDRDLITITMDGENGDATISNPKFYGGQKVIIYDHSGNALLNTSVNSIVSSPFQIVISDPLPYFIQFGSVVADVSDSSSSGVHNYQLGSHVQVDNNDGQVYNVQLPPPLGPSETIHGNELVDVSVSYLNGNTDPNRPPVMDGLTLSDNGRYPDVVRSYVNELKLLEEEKQCLDQIGLCSFFQSPVGFTSEIINSSLEFKIGDQVEILSSSYSHEILTITNIINTTTYQFTPTIVYNSSSHDIMNRSYPDNIRNVVNNEINTLEANVESPSSSYILGGLNNEILICLNLASLISNIVISNSGTITNLNTLTSTVDFSAYGVNNSNYIIIQSGNNLGLYKILSVSGSSIQIDTNSPYGPFYANETISFQILELDQFSSSVQTDFIADAIRSARDFSSISNTWRSNIRYANKASRLNDINNRISSLNTYIDNIQSILSGDEKIYDSRYLWIDQRINLKTGFISKSRFAASQKAEKQSKIIKDQQKLLIMEKL